MMYESRIFDDGVARTAYVDFTPLDARSARKGDAVAGDEWSSLP